MIFEMQRVFKIFLFIKNGKVYAHLNINFTLVLIFIQKHLNLIL